MTVILSGGGSGGHITPILAVAESIKEQSPGTKVIYIGQKGDNFLDITSRSKSIDEIYSVRAGKYRRYYKEGLKQLFDIKTFLLNCRDFVYLCIGTGQSIRLMRKLKPDVLFTRGGFVSVPVAVGARLNHVPYFTHDSDSVPSLANRIIAKRAYKHLVAMDEDIYPYPRDKTIKTGIPISNKFKLVLDSDKRNFKTKLKYPADSQLLFVIGGGLGSKAINDAVVGSAKELLNTDSLYIAHVAGKQNETEVNDSYKQALDSKTDRVRVLGFIDNVDEYSGAADIVIARAGATNIAEFAAQGKACVIIPSSFLVGGHQLKNAEELKRHNAAIILDEKSLEASPGLLGKEVSALLKDKQKQKELCTNILKLAALNSSDEIAKLILSVKNEAQTP